MNWLAILQFFLRISASIASYMQSRQLMEAGKAEQIVQNLKEAQNAIKKANKARTSAEHNFDKRDGVPDDKDPYLRD